MKELKKSIGYIKKNTSIEEQKEAILLYANNNGYTISEWVIGDASKGLSELSKIFERQPKPLVEAVMVYKVQYLTRDVRAYVDLLDQLEKKNIKLLVIFEIFRQDPLMKAIVQRKKR